MTDPAPLTDKHSCLDWGCDPGRCVDRSRPVSSSSPAPLTDEELATLQRDASGGPHSIVRRLIADLCAARAEKERLWKAIDHLWGWMGAEEVRAMREVEPDLVEVAQQAHQRESHGEKVPRP